MDTSQSKYDEVVNLLLQWLEEKGLQAWNSEEGIIRVSIGDDRFLDLLIYYPGETWFMSANSWTVTLTYASDFSSSGKSMPTGPYTDFIVSDPEFFPKLGRCINQYEHT